MASQAVRHSSSGLLTRSVAQNRVCSKHVHKFAQAATAVVRGAAVLSPPQRPRSRTIPARAWTKLDEVNVSTSTVPPGEEKQIRPGVFEGYWQWKGYNIRYQRSGDSGTPMVLVHGFGGNADHWRKNTAALAQQGYRTFAVDLLGYGFSDKPDPRPFPPNSIYCFDTWGEQLVDFIKQKVGEPSFIISNSVGGLAGLQAAINDSTNVLGVQLLDISLRNLHVSRQAPAARPFIAAFQQLLRDTPLGEAFFGSVAQPQTVANILRQAYGVKEAVTDELVEVILRPGLQPAAVRVFLDFISYSGGPLPEELLEKVSVPVSILWGEADPWEPVLQGKQVFGHYPAVMEFITLPGVGHCPQDEAPEVVNPLVVAFVEKVMSQRKGGLEALSN